MPGSTKVSSGRGNACSEILHELVDFEVGFFREHRHFGRLYLRFSSPACCSADRRRCGDDRQLRRVDVGCRATFSRGGRPRQFCSGAPMGARPSAESGSPRPSRRSTRSSHVGRSRSPERLRSTTSTRSSIARSSSDRTERLGRRVVTATGRLDQPRTVLVCTGRPAPVRAEFRRVGEGLLDRDSALETGERGAEAEVDAESERTWWSNCGVTSNRSASSYLRSSRPADPVSRSTFDPAGIVTPWRLTSSFVQRPCTGEGASKRSSSSMPAARHPGGRARSAAVGLLAEQECSPAEQFADGLGAGGDQQHGEVRRLGDREAARPVLVVDLGQRRRRQHVVARRLGALRHQFGRGTRRAWRTP